MKTKLWKLISFGMIALMITHLVLLQISMAKYSSFPNAEWYQDSGKIFLTIFYALPILVVLGFTIKLPKEKFFAFLKSGVILLADFLIFIYMLFVYHNPTRSELTLLCWSCLSIALASICLLFFETYKLRHPSNKQKAIN